MTLPLAAEKKRSSRAAWIWSIVKWGLCLLVIGFVGRRAWEIWQESDVQELEFHWGWLLLSAVAYFAAWMPAGWIWQQAQRISGASIPYPQAVRAYWCGLLGKYVPGKATVLVIRAGMVKNITGKPGLAAVTGVYESLFSMGIGAAVAVAWSPLLVSPDRLKTWPEWLQMLVSRPWLPLVLMLSFSLLMMPLLSFSLTRLSRKLVPRQSEDVTPEIHIPNKYLIVGFFASLVGWMLHGTCLMLVLKSVDPNLEPTFHLWSICIGSASLATSIGFLAIFTPGGLGVREGLLMGTLGSQPMIGPATAMMAALLLRLVSLVTELVMSAVLYYGISPNPAHNGGTHPQPDGSLSET